jgi:hypothetical protein
MGILVGYLGALQTRGYRVDFILPVLQEIRRRLRAETETVLRVAQFPGVRQTFIPRNHDDDDEKKQNYIDGHE